MSCCASAFTYLVPRGGGSAFAFPPMTPWDGATYEFDFTSWLAPACQALPLTTELGFALVDQSGAALTVTAGADSLTAVSIYAMPGTVQVSNVTVGAGTASVTIQDGVPWSPYVLTAQVTTVQGRTGSFSASFFVEGGPPASSPYLAVETGYPLCDEFGRLLY